MEQRHLYHKPNSVPPIVFMTNYKSVHDVSCSIMLNQQPIYYVNTWGTTGVLLSVTTLGGDSE